MHCGSGRRHKPPLVHLVGFDAIRPLHSKCSNQFNQRTIAKFAHWWFPDNARAIIDITNLFHVGRVTSKHPRNSIFAKVVFLTDFGRYQYLIFSLAMLEKLSWISTSLSFSILGCEAIKGLKNAFPLLLFFGLWRNRNIYC